MAEMIWESGEMRFDPEGPLSKCEVIPGAVLITMTFDRPNCRVRLHSHAFDHRMECIKGRAVIELDGHVQIVSDGQSLMIEAHRNHSIRSLQPGTVLRCVHEHDDIQPTGEEGIPAEWLGRLTDKVA